MTKNFYIAGATLLPDRIRIAILAIAVVLLLVTGSFSRVAAQPAVLLDLGAGEFGEVSMGGFEITTNSRVSIDAVCLDASDTRPLASTAWILDADSRLPVWTYNEHDADRSDRYVREITEDIFLEAGMYEVYYASHLDWESKDWSRRSLRDILRNAIREIFDRDTWLSGDDQDERFHDLQGRLGIRVRSDQSGRVVENKEALSQAFLSTAFLTMTSIPDERYVAEGFELKRPLDVEVYAMGEFTGGANRYDYGWIINVDSRQKVWEMEPSELAHAGGAQKNRMARQILSLEPGRYAAFYATDGSHSSAEWNAPPPFDPDFWGLTLRVQDQNDLRYVSRFDYENISVDNAIVALRGVGDDEHRTAGFSVERPLEVRIYALGEGRDGRMFDYGWIVDASSHETVWHMDFGATEHAGGARKNRVFDGVIKLGAGNYIAHFVTDDSHAYGDWNTDGPFDAGAWGLTVAPVNAEDVSLLSAYSPSEDRFYLASIREVGDRADRHSDFELEKDARVRIFAVGEGSGDQMYDYGWIERLDTGDVVWEMTYRMTEHAGGAQKNRMVNSVFMLPAGSYRLHYTSDGSHSYWDWNADPPLEPDMWGITISHERRASGI